MKSICLIVITILMIGCRNNHEAPPTEGRDEKVTRSHFEFGVIKQFERETVMIAEGMTKQEVLKELPTSVEINDGYNQEVLRAPDKETQEKNEWILMYGTGTAIGTTGQLRILFQENKVIKLESRNLALP